MSWFTPPPTRTIKCGWPHNIDPTVAGARWRKGRPRHPGSFLATRPNPFGHGRLISTHPLMCAHYSTCCGCLDCKRRERQEATQRASCPACKGDVSLCVGEQDRPLYCAVFTADGERRPVVVVAPAQPWTVRKAA